MTRSRRRTLDFGPESSESGHDTTSSAMDERIPVMSTIYNLFTFQSSMLPRKSLSACHINVYFLLDFGYTRVVGNDEVDIDPAGAASIYILRSSLGAPTIYDLT